MYRWPPAPVMMFLSRRKGPLMWRHAPGLLAPACASMTGASPAVTAATEAARTTALVSRRTSFIVTSWGAARRPRPRTDRRNPQHLRRDKAARIRRIRGGLEMGGLGTAPRDTGGPGALTPADFR